MEQTGNVIVETTTTGEDLDPDGYLLTVHDKSATIEPNGTATIVRVPRGETIMEIGDVAENCTVLGGTARTVFPGSPFIIPVEVECVAVAP